MSIKKTPSPVLQWVKRTLKAWHRAEAWIAICAFAAIAGLLVYDVVSRELFVPLLSKLGLEPTQIILYGSQKLAVYFLVVAAFSGIGIATATGAQLIPKVAFNLVPSRWNKMTNRMADMVTAVLLVGLTYLATQFVLESMASGQHVSGGLNIEIWKVQIAIPLGFGSAAVRYLAFAIWPEVRPEIAGEAE